jgi:hypothetical protein
MGRVVDRLGVRADWVLFGHVHRGGPYECDDAVLWHGPPHGPRLGNTGAWVHEPLLVHGAGPKHPYWPGGAVRVIDEGDPVPVQLLGALHPWP